MNILTFVSGACANIENPSKIYSWSSYSITVGLSVLKKQTKPPQSKQKAVLLPPPKTKLES